jgi:hypothetical protein
LDKINWTELSRNPNVLNAIHLLEKYPEKINWCSLSKNPNAMHLLEIVLQHDSENPFAVPLVEIDWSYLSSNPSIFEIDTKKTNKELMKKAKNIDYN